MFFIRCPFCHKLVLRIFYRSHRSKHMQRRTDGQMASHVTVHPSGRFQGSLDGVPRSYTHTLCGLGAGVPEDIVRSYLANPFLYRSDHFFCHGCKDYVPCKDLFWRETQQSLAEYFKELRTEYLRVHGSPPPETEA